MPAHTAASTAADSLDELNLSLVELNLRLPDRCDGDGLYAGGRLRLTARDAHGGRALASLRTALSKARGDADRQVLIIRRQLPYFLVANRDHLVCLSDSPGLFGDVAALASRPGALAAFTRGSLKVLADAPQTAGNPTATTRLIEWARNQGIDVVRNRRTSSPATSPHEALQRIASA